MERLEQELCDADRRKEFWKNTIKFVTVAAPLTGGIYLASHPEHIEAIRDYLTRFWH
jgi:hypothetical protein